MAQAQGITPTPALLHSSHAPTPVSVKELVDAGCGHVPPSLVRSLEDRPCSAHVLQPDRHPPVIDISELRRCNGTRQQAVQEIGRASEKWGFFQVKNHGVPKPVVETMWAAYHRLFELPADERAQYDSGPGLPASIVASMQQARHRNLSKLKMWKDTMRFIDFDPEDVDALSHAPEFFREAALEYFKEVRSLGIALYQAVSESLGLDSNYLYNAMGQNPAMSTSLHYYSPCPDPSLTIGILPHVDMDSITVLLQDQTAGLQVLKEDQWVEVNPVPDAFVINIGEVIQVMSNGKLKSVMHRVVNNTEKPRASIACFFRPKPDARIGPISQFTSEDNPPRYEEEPFADQYYNHFARILN